MANKKKTKRERNFIMSNNWTPYVEQLLDSYIGIDFPTPESKEQQEWMKSLILDKVRQTGMLSGDITFTDYDVRSPANMPSPYAFPFTQHGANSPQTAYQNTLGRGEFNIKSTGGTVNWSPRSTKYDFDLTGRLGKIPGFNVINEGGLLGILKEKITGVPSGPQHYIPNIQISREDLNKAFRSRHLKGQQEFSD